MRIVQFAPFLQFSLNRFVYDLKTYQRIKLNQECKFPLVLDVSSFLKNDNKENVEKNMIWLNDLKNSDGIKEAIKKTKEFKNNNNVYDLVSVVCHNGSALGGHYTVYIRDIMNENTLKENKDEDIIDIKNEDNDDEELFPSYENTINMLLRKYNMILNKKGFTFIGPLEYIYKNYYSSV